MSDARLRLDGNSVVGLLAELFQDEITSTEITCAHCGLVRQLGAQVVYHSARGSVVRCVGCGNVLIRVA